MANELNILLNTGLTVTAQPYTAGAASGAALSLSEIGASGLYTGNMTGAAGTYQIVFLSGGLAVGYGSIVWDGSAEITFPTAQTISNQVRTELATELGRIDATVSSRNATAPDNVGIAAIKAKTDNLPAQPAAVGDAMTLTSAYDAAKTAATQTSVDGKPTLADIEASTVLATKDDVSNIDLSSISTKEEIASQVRVELTPELDLLREPDDLLGTGLL